MINLFFKTGLMGTIILYLYGVLKVFYPLFAEDFRDRDYYNLGLDLILLILFPFSMLSATKKYINIVLTAPELLCDHDYKEIGQKESDGVWLKYTECAKCGHIVVSANKKEEADATKR